MNNVEDPQNENDAGNGASAEPGDDGGHRSLMKKVGPEDLRRIFRSYDEDGSGEISCDELQSVLVKLTGKLPSDTAVKAILEDIDADGSGTIDEDEFLEFFARIENLNQLQAQLQMMGKKSGVQKKFTIMFVGLNFLAFCAFCLLDLGAEPGTLKAKLGRIGIIISGSSLGLVFFMGLLAPIVKYKCGASKLVSTIVEKAHKKLPGRGLFDRRGGVVLRMQKATEKMTKEERLVKQAEDAFASLPRAPAPPPPNLSPAVPPETSSYQYEQREPYQSYRRSVRMQPLESPKSPAALTGFSDWPMQPSTPATPASVVKVGNPNFNGYNLKNYDQARRIMAGTGNQSFTPVTMSKAKRNPWLSQVASEQIMECQPDLWVDNARSSPGASAPLSPHFLGDHPHLPEEAMHMQSKALALRDVLPPNKVTIIVGKDQNLSLEG